MTADVVRTAEALRFQLLAPLGEVAWVSVHPQSAYRRLFTDKVLIREPKRRALVHYLIGSKLRTRDPLPDERF